MWTLRKKFTFEAAHKLPHHDGKCRRLHGHSWVMWVVLESKDLEGDGPKQGMVMDYADIKAEVKPIVEDFLDHHYLNETLDLESPTSEAIAQWLYLELAVKLPLLKSVIVEETCTCACEYAQ